MSKKDPIFEYLEQIAELIPTPFWWNSLDKVVMGCNKTCLTAVGASSIDDFVGKNAFAMYQDKEIAQMFEEWMNEVIQTENPSSKEHKIIDLKTGKFKYFSGTFAPLKNKRSQIVGLVGTSIETTAEKEAAIAEKKALLAQEEMTKLKHERDLDLIRSEAHKNKIMQEFGVIAAKVAHDISSPLMVANSSIYKLKDKLSADDEHIQFIEQSLQDIKNISGKILTTYREITGSNSKVKLHRVDDGNIKRHIFLSSLLENQIGFKKIEWQNNPCTLELKIHDNARNIFSYISPTEFNRSFSNLLNNAYDSLVGNSRNINVELDISSDTKKFILTIKDTGSGIPKDKIAKVLAGESTKHEGNGMGLSGAKTYFEFIGGKLELKSSVDHGTEIIIELPIANDPTWFERSINCTADPRIAVLDDSSTIIMLWQRLLSDKNLTSNYFMNVDDFMKWYDNQDNKENIILFADYDLGDESFTGLDLVNQLKEIKSYLVTNHAEEAWVQEIVKNNNLKLLPKKIIEHLEFELV